MAKFFNRTKGPVSFDLADGTPIVVSPKSYLEIPGEISISAELNMLLRKGMLQLFVEAPTSVPKAATPVVEVVPPAPADLIPPEPPKAGSVSQNSGGRVKAKSDLRNFRPSQVVSTPPVVAVETVKVEAETGASPVLATSVSKTEKDADTKAATLE